MILGSFLIILITFFSLFLFFFQSARSLSDKGCRKFLLFLEEIFNLPCGTLFEYVEHYESSDLGDANSMLFEQLITREMKSAFCFVLLIRYLFSLSLFYSTCAN